MSPSQLLWPFFCLSLYQVSALGSASFSGHDVPIDSIFLGISIPGISFPSRSVTLKGFNNLENGVQIQTFDLPANDPAGGIHLTLEATVTNVTELSFFMLSSIIHF